MQYTYFDIETGPLPDEELTAMIPPFDPAEVKTGNLKDPDKIAAKLQEAEVNHIANARDKAALSPLTGKVLAIGLETDGAATLLAFEHEWETLNEFWLIYASTHAMFVGFNINSFDLPFLIKRSWKLGVPVPGGVRNGRWWGDRFHDLRDEWQMGDRMARGSLDAVCKFFGVEGKNGNGKDFARLFELNRDAALEYLENDLRMTRRAHEGMRGVAA